MPGAEVTKEDAQSFAQHLARQAASERARRLAEDAERASKWVQDQLEQFKKVCETQSLKGKMSASHYTEHLPRVYFESRKDVLFNELQGELANLGFSELRLAWKHDLKRKVFAPSVGWTTSTGVGIAIEASWDGLDEPPEAGPHFQGGASGICAICKEEGRVVVLAPCGHVMCNMCQQKQGGRQCPFCRQAVRCVTHGLFMS
mmetsp:Transcript_44019/g.82280  ORF Transcript_44019/g.82280 Transcript_44019/m.82280 type:complete len:202 (+) Transcript_44019:66-671(+)